MPELCAPVGGEFLIRGMEAGQIFTPEKLSDESRLIARTMEDFVRKEILPVVPKLEAHEPGLLLSLFKKAGRIGLLAGGIPEEYGGLGLSKTALTLLTEKAAPYLSFAIGTGVHSGVSALPLLFFGTEAQKAEWLPKLASGEIIAAFALSETGSGSDAFAARTKAVLTPDGSHYILNGEKLWITNAGFADLFTVFAQADGERFTAFLVPRNTHGLSIGREENKMGLHGSSTCRLLLQEAQIPISNVIGEVGKGARAALYALNIGRFHIGATALGAAKECLRLAALHANQRVQFGRPIARFDLIRQKLAQMATRIYLLESMIYRIAGYWEAENSTTEFTEEHTGKPGTEAVSIQNPKSKIQNSSVIQNSEEYAMECAIIKFFGTEVLAFAADEALQIHGGMGFSEELPISRMYRDARVFRIFEGTNEINRLTVLDQIARRVKSGRLDLNTNLVPAAANEIGTQIELIRAVLLETLAAGIETQGEQIGKNQIFAAAIADLSAALFALESGALRANGSEIAEAIITCFAAEACENAEKWARSAFASLQSEEFVSLSSAALAELRNLPMRNTTSLRQQIADAVIENEGHNF